MFGKKKKAAEAAPAVEPVAASTEVPAAAAPEAAPATPVAAAPETVAGGSVDAEQNVDPEMMQKIAAVRSRIQSTFGQIVLAMTAVPRYRHQTIADLAPMVLEPLIRDRIAIATPKTDNDQAGPGALAGIAIWASVSPEVDAKILEQIKGGVFPVRLKPEEWTSGKTVWLLDLIAPSQKLSTAVLANFRQIVKEGNVRIHPIVARMVDPELLKKMGAQPTAGGAVPNQPGTAAVN